ncbi:MAG TPA: FGGY family carbohydrate kinase [Candidatus Deferrimicrobium sp.]|nr:FGGY family carbohydrate kinase [Candidatus Deferrimicrobium sp.]
MFCGIDLGTTGIRSIVVDSEGSIILNIQYSIPHDILYKGCENLPANWHEQNPMSWRDKFYEVLRSIIKEIVNLGRSLDEVRAICTDSTSGTILPVDDRGRPLANAIMYNDLRAQEETQKIQEVAIDFSQKVGYKFNASFSLPKILWIKKHFPIIFEKTHKFLHANDFLIGELLSDDYYYSDSSNCLKAGYDFIDEEWPSFIEHDLSLDLAKMPKVVAPGKIVGKTSEKLEKLTGFPSGILVLGGATDSTMALIASGASNYGDIFSSLGTTLVPRVLTRELIRDPKGRVYCHIFPGKKRMYLPGGASSVGAECLQAYFPNINYQFYDQQALNYFPTDSITYPLVKKGERFPFVNPNAEHFYQGPQENEFQKYTTYLQAVAFVERLSLAVLENLGADVKDRVFTIGGGTKSLPWLQIRADVLQKTVYRPKIIEAAYGAAILAASTVLYDEDLTAAVQKFVKPDLIVNPRIELKEKIEKRYNEFLFQLKTRFQFQM